MSDLALTRRGFLKGTAASAATIAAGSIFSFGVLYALKDFLIKQVGSLLEHTT